MSSGLRPCRFKAGMAVPASPGIAAAHVCNSYMGTAPGFWPCCAQRCPQTLRVQSPRVSLRQQRMTSQQPMKGSQMSIADHVGLLLGLVAGRVLPRTRRRPELRERPEDFRCDLRTTGLGLVSVPSRAVAAMRAFAEEMYSSRSGRSSLVRAGGLNGAFPETMAWHWATNENGMEPFQPAAEAIRSQLDQDFQLVAASLVIADGDCPVGASRMHLDFGPPSIPKYVAATALLPVYPQVFPQLEGGLEYLPWDGEGEVVVQRYREGEAVVFDGKLAHRTQPFTKEAFMAAAEKHSSGMGERLAGLRVLASLSFVSLPPRAFWRRAVRQVLEGYGAPVMPHLRDDVGHDVKDLSS
eukprot:CAMPEP_0172666948 /NCGR_PEP_ID=MMETSP1074-20121228/8121_1 /TAXON_ID=2916 /ORGANISM="Ceratium fusus, Strain PA161109" /LENGTH=352 /DNA_ID=CAMNT_0013483397 /DNA_START=46 /DNA_END=1104 /DNA_ORIENTATION=+